MAELDDVADDLYGGPPSVFIAHRDAAAKAARKDGDRDLAQQITELRKPTVSAWLVNLLVRDDPGFANQIVALGEGLRDAERSLDGPALRELSTQRRQLVRGLTARARHLAQPAGQRIGDAVTQELDATLTAALADPEFAREVTSGRLTAARVYAGFGSADGATATPRTGPDREQPVNQTKHAKPKEAAAHKPTLTIVRNDPDETDEPRESAADRDRRVRAQERERRAREEAQAAWEAAERAVAEASQKHTAAQEARDESAAELARAEAAATQAHDDEDDLVRALAEARRRLAAAGKAATAADREVSSAQQNLRHDEREASTTERELRRAERTRDAMEAAREKGTS